jgi:hypothetical protein
MSKYVPGEIWIGGKIAATLVPDLCTAISQQGVALEWGDCVFAPATAEDLLKAARPTKSGVRLLRLCNREARWGRFTRLERFLENHRVAYTRFSAGQQDYDHEKVEFRPNTGQVEMVGDSQGKPIVAASRVRAVEPVLAGTVESARSGLAETATRSVQPARMSLQASRPGELPSLQPFEIVAGFPCPQLVCTSEKAPF